MTETTGPLAPVHSKPEFYLKCYFCNSGPNINSRVYVTRVGNILPCNKKNVSLHFTQNNISWTIRIIEIINAGPFNNQHDVINKSDDVTAFIIREETIIVGNCGDFFSKVVNF